MEKISRFTSDEREDLTAYLDGELEEQRANEIEQKLTRSEFARREVEILSRTWDMLSLLPESKVSAGFSRKTIAIALQAEEPLLDRSEHVIRWVRRGSWLAGWIVAMCVAAFLGYELTFRVLPDGSRMLVEELPIIENLDDYREVGDIEFLRQLKTRGVFAEEAADVPHE